MTSAGCPIWKQMSQNKSSGSKPSSLWDIQPQGLLTSLPGHNRSLPPRTRLSPPWVLLSVSFSPKTSGGGDLW